MKLTGRAGKIIDGLATNTQGAARNAFIDVYGKIVVVFYQKKIGEDFLIVFPSQFRERLEKHLATPMRIGKARLEEIRLHAFFVTREPENCELFVEENGGFILFTERAPSDFEEMSEEEFDCFRMENGIAMQGKEFDEEMIMNTEWGNAVSFSKGCFLGQEIVAKVTQRGKPPRKMVRIAFDSEPKEIPFVEMRSKCFSQKLGKWIAYCSMPNDGNPITFGTLLE